MRLHCSCLIVTSLLFLVTHGILGCCSYRASPLSTSLTLLGFIGQHSYSTSPFHSLAHLLFLYIFYFHRLFAKTFRLSWPNYHIFTSYYSSGLLLLSQSNEFTNSFTSHLPLIVSMGLLLHSLGFINPFTSSLPVIILVDLLAIIPAILSYWACFCYFLSSLSSYCWASFTIGPFVKSGHQQGFCLMNVFLISQQITISNLIFDALYVRIVICYWCLHDIAYNLT